MLLTIHNLPFRTQYNDVKTLILSKCGLSEVILDNIQKEGGGLRVTVGVMEERDAAIVVQKLNGLYYKGQQLYVKDKRQIKETKQPYQTSEYQSHYVQHSQSANNCIPPLLTSYQHLNYAAFQPSTKNQVSAQTNQISYLGFGEVHTVQDQSQQPTHERGSPYSEPAGRWGGGRRPSQEYEQREYKDENYGDEPREQGRYDRDSYEGRKHQYGEDTHGGRRQDDGQSSRNSHVPQDGYSPRGGYVSRSGHTPRGGNTTRGGHTPRSGHTTREDYTPRGRDSCGEPDSIQHYRDGHNTSERGPAGDFGLRQRGSRSGFDSNEPFSRGVEFDEYGSRGGRGPIQQSFDLGSNDRGQRGGPSSYEAGSRGGPNSYEAGSRGGPNSYEAGPRGGPNSYEAGSREGLNSYEARSYGGPNLYEGGSRGASNSYEAAGSHERTNSYEAGSRRTPNTYEPGSGGGPNSYEAESRGGKNSFEAGLGGHPNSDKAGSRGGRGSYETGARGGHVQARGSRGAYDDGWDDRSPQAVSHKRRWEEPTNDYNRPREERDEPVNTRPSRPRTREFVAQPPPTKKNRASAAPNAEPLKRQRDTPAPNAPPQKKLCNLAAPNDLKIEPKTVSLPKSFNATVCRSVGMLMFDVGTNLNIINTFTGPSPQKKALRKALNERVLSLTHMLENLTSEEIIKRYRAAYPKTSDRAFYNEIKRSVAEGAKAPVPLPVAAPLLSLKPNKGKINQPALPAKVKGAAAPLPSLKPIKGKIVQPAQPTKVPSQAKGAPAPLQSQKLKKDKWPVLPAKIANQALGASNNAGQLHPPSEYPMKDRKLQPVLPGKIPSHVEGDKKLHNQQKRQHKQDLEQLPQYDLSEIQKKVLQEEVNSITVLIANEFKKASNATEKAIFETYGDQNGCVEQCNKFLCHHISKRLTNSDLKLARIYGRPKPPRRPELEEFLKNHGCISLKKATKMSYYTASFDSFETIDELSAKPVKFPSGITVSFRQMHFVIPTPKMNQKNAKHIRRKFVESLVDNCKVNLLDKDWQKQEQEEKKKIEAAESDDVIIVEKNAADFTVDITGDDDATVTKSEEKARATAAGNQQFLHKDFKVIDEVHESDCDEVTSEFIQEKTMDPAVDDDWDAAGEDWGDDCDGGDGDDQDNNGGDKDKAAETDNVKDGKDEVGGVDFDVDDIHIDDLDEGDLEDY